MFSAGPSYCQVSNFFETTPRTRRTQYRIPKTSKKIFRGVHVVEKGASADVDAADVDVSVGHPPGQHPASHPYKKFLSM
jgi:hypothetical protein